MATREKFKERIHGRDIGSEKNVKAYCRWVDYFHNWRGAPENVKVTENDLIDFESALEEADPDELPWAVMTDSYAYSSRIQAVSAVMLWAKRIQNQTFESDADVLVHGEKEPFDPDIIPRDEVDTLLHESCSRPGCIVARNVGYDAIMRGAEVVELGPDDVDATDGTVYVEGKKNSQNRHIGVSQRTMDLLTNQVERVQTTYKNPNYLFYRTTGLKALSAKAWNEHFRLQHHEAGFHSFGRHTPIVHRLEDGEDFWDVFVRARHQHAPMTARYASIAGRTKPSEMQ